MLTAITKTSNYRSDSNNDASYLRFFGGVLDSFGVTLLGVISLSDDLISKIKLFEPK